MFKGWSGTKNISPALVTPPLLVPFTTEEMAGCANKAAKGANKAPRNPPSCFFVCHLYSSFTVSVTPSINTPESSNDFIIVIIFIFSFEIK